MKTCERAYHNTSGVVKGGVEEGFPGGDQIANNFTEVFVDKSLALSYNLCAKVIASNSVPSSVR